MNWNVLLFESSRGEKPVEDFIKKQRPQAKAKIVRKIRLLKQCGNLLGMPHAKTLDSGLYELRIRGKEEIRIFYCFLGSTTYILHAFKKQTQKTPQKELDIAFQRTKNIKS